MCETAGLPVIKHAFGDLGITTIATAQVLAAMPSPQLGHQQFLTFLVHDLLSEKVEFVDGAIAVPAGPGSGSNSTGKHSRSTRASTSNTESSRATAR